MKDTIKNEILRYLANGQTHWGGQISLDLALKLNKKASNIERRCRELEDEKKIVSSYEKVNGRGAACVKYRINTTDDRIAHRIAVKSNPTVKMFA